MPDHIDPRAANVAMHLAVARWKRFPDDSIAASLDEPAEWVQEASIMNQYLPAYTNSAGYSFISVHPQEFQVGITLVRNYAGLIYRHMVALQPFVGNPMLHVNLFDAGAPGEKVAADHSKIKPSELAARTNDFFGFEKSGAV